MSDQIIDAMPFARELGIELGATGPDEVTGRLPWAPDAARPAVSCTAAP